MRATQDHATVWACIDCTSLHANGDVGDPAPEHEPLGLIGPNEHVTLGLVREEHSCDYDTDWSAGNCQCERDEFSWSSCDTCGSPLGGERHAMTIWSKD
jgi:hypothetical protein